VPGSIAPRSVCKSVDLAGCRLTLTHSTCSDGEALQRGRGHAPSGLRRESRNARSQLIVAVRAAVRKARALRFADDIPTSPSSFPPPPPPPHHPLLSMRIKS